MPACPFLAQTGLIKWQLINNQPKTLRPSAWPDGLTTAAWRLAWGFHPRSAQMRPTNKSKLVAAIRHTATLESNFLDDIFY